MSRPSMFPSLREMLTAAEAERDALRKHYEAAAGPDHNLLALLDLYLERQEQAEAEVARVQPLVALAEAVLAEGTWWRDVAGHCERCQCEPVGACEDHARESGKLSRAVYDAETACRRARTEGV